MFRLQYRDIKVPVANVLSLCPTDSRVFSYVNRTCERLLYMMKSVGTIHRYQVCVKNACITWPREIETIEAVCVCNRPGTVRNHYYEFLAQGPGIGNQVLCTGRQLIDQPESCAFDDVLGTGKKLAVYTDGKEDPGATITLQYLDNNAQFVRKPFNGALLDGERIALPAAGAYAYSSNQVMANGLIRVYRDATKYTTRLYEFDTANGALKPLAYYAPDETTPIYRRSLIPGLNTSCGSSSNSSTCGSSVVVVGKIRFMPVSQDNDFLCISQPEAIRLGCQAVLKEENSKLAEAMELWQLAVGVLQSQLKHWQGDGAVAPITVQSDQFPNVTSLV